MAAAPLDDLGELSRSLESAVIACNERCLYNSAKWVSELLNSLPKDLHESDDHDPDYEGYDADELDDSTRRPNDSREARLQRRERKRYLLAKSCFDCKEFDRCAVTLIPALLPQLPSHNDGVTVTTPVKSSKGKARAGATPAVNLASQRTIPEMSQKSLFLGLYAKYIAGEKRKEEESEMILGPNDGPVTLNKELPVLSTALDEHFRAREGEQTIRRQSDGFLEYLYGIVLLKGRNESQAKQWLLRSISLFEWNWGAWLELASLVTSMDDLNAICQKLAPSFPAFLFQIYCSQELYQSSEAVHDRIDRLSDLFPTSAFLATQRALIHYHAKDYDAAASIFSTLLAQHPYRLDALDIYSNILYVTESARPKLSYLASLTSTVDRFRPETCVIIGNHYSKASEHEKAVVYFRRALALDRSFLSAWTLMGHEYIELKNTQAAIEAYRRAVDCNKNDYRAWHGLGLGYEIMDMHSYALYYFQRAAGLQPWDPKLWTAVGNAFAKCSKPVQAIRAFKRALAASSEAGGAVGGDTPGGAAGQAGRQPGTDVDPLAACLGGRLDPDILHQIAMLYEEMQEMDEAAAYMELCLAQEEGPDEEDLLPGVLPGPGTGVTQTTSKARLWLSKWALATGDWERCMELANESCQDGYEVEEAKGLIKDARAQMEMQ